MRNINQILYVLSGCVNVGFVLSTTKLMGLFFIHIQRDLDCSAATVSLVLGLIPAMSFLYGPLEALVYQNLGSRAATIIGALFTSAGLASSSIISQIQGIAVIYAIFPAFGIGIANLAVFTMNGEIFNSKLSVINNTFSSSHSVTSFMLAPLVQFLIVYYGWRGALLLVGGIILQAVPAALINGRLFEELKSKLENLNSKSEVIANRRGDQLKMESNTKSLQGLLRNPLFVMYAIAMTFATVSRTSLFLYTVRFAQSVGIPDDKAVWILTVQELICVICAPMLGYITSSPSSDAKQGKTRGIRSVIYALQSVPRTCSFAFLSTLFGFTTLIPIISETYAGFFVTGVLSGIILGGTTALPVTVLADLFRKDLATAQGLRCFLAGLGLILYPLLVGFIIDITGSYRPSAYAGALTSFISAILTFATHVGVKRKEIQHNRHIPTKRKSDSII